MVGTKTVNPPKPRYVFASILTFLLTSTGGIPDLLGHHHSSDRDHHGGHHDYNTASNHRVIGLLIPPELMQLCFSFDHLRTGNA